MTELGTVQKTALNKASRKAVQQCFTGLRQHFSRDCWIDTSNRYLNDCIRNLDTDTKTGYTVDHDHLATYIAASAILHCADGWSFLGRALDCHNRGDSNTARHIGYYAELRAAIALLAGDGIGIFSDRHFVVDSNCNCQILPNYQGNKHPRTHDITWLALKHWASLGTSADLLADIITPGGIPLRSWLDCFRAGASFVPITGKWLETWGLDLERFSDDREARNEASYRPNRFRPQIPLDVLISSSFLRDLWTMCEPSAPSRFTALDRHLLRLCLGQAYEAITGRKTHADSSRFAIRIDKMLDNIVPGGLSTKSEWSHFLTRTVERDDSMTIREASGKLPIGDPKHHVQVLSRAALLLRIATGSCSQLIRQAGFTRSDLEFWWKPLGEALGLWGSGEEPSELTDLWADVQTALQETEAWESANRGGTTSFAKLRRQLPTPLLILAGCERIALWGLGV